MSEKKTSANQGMTLIELIVVLAIIAIISAVLIPNFINTTDKARLKGDIQSAKVIQNALALYNAEQSTAMNVTAMSDILEELNDKGYIESDFAVIQTEGANWVMAEDGQTVKVDITPCGVPDSKIRKTVYNQLSDQEKLSVKGGTSQTGGTGGTGGTDDTGGTGG